MCKRIIPDFESTSCGLGLHLNIGSQYALSVRATVVGIVADSGRFFAHVRGILAFEVDEMTVRNKLLCASTGCRVRGSLNALARIFPLTTLSSRVSDRMFGNLPIVASIFFHE